MLIRYGVHLLHSTYHIVCDGNFKFQPEGFGQVYTFHAVRSDLPDRSEAFLIAIALLTNKERVTYNKLFDRLTLKLHEEFGGLGAIKCGWHILNHL